MIQVMLALATYFTTPIDEWLTPPEPAIIHKWYSEESVVQDYVNYAYSLGGVTSLNSLNVRMVDEIRIECQKLTTIEYVSLIISIIKLLSILMTFRMYINSWIIVMRNTKWIQNSGIDQIGKYIDKNVKIMSVIDFISLHK